jgi:hypothetical protein
MAGSITVSSITLDSDNNFSIKSNTGATLFFANTSGVDIANSIGATAITNDKILSIAITKISGNIISSQIAPSVTLTTPLISGNLNFDANGTSGIRLTSANTLTLHTTGTEDMRIDSVGNVLIGTTTSQTGAKLSVTGGIQGTITSGTAVASTSGTSIDFTSIPSWVKRITVIYNGVSLNGTSSILVQLGVGSTPTTTGYKATQIYWIQDATGYGGTNSTSGFPTQMGSATYLMYGTMVFNLLSSNTWVGGGTLINQTTTIYMTTSYGNIALGGVLGMVRITTANGTDTFDAGSINILYEG